MFGRNHKPETVWNKAFVLSADDNRGFVDLLWALWKVCGACYKLTDPISWIEESADEQLFLNPKSTEVNCP